MKALLRVLVEHLPSLIHDILAKVISALLPTKVIMNPRYAELWEQKGFQVTPVHYYSPIPPIQELRQLNWERDSTLAGIDLNLERQLRFLREEVPKYAAECAFPVEPTNIPHQFHLNSGFFESFDAEILHCMIRTHKPRRIIEIGSGYTTYLSARASLINQEHDGLVSDLYAIEPFPNDTLREGFPGLSVLIPKPVQEVDLDFFLQLEENDILFIDSTHTVRIGSDVLSEYLEILPRLRKGVLVHIHDIFLPRDYPMKWILSLRWFFSEQYLLQAFLCFNSAFEVVWASSAMALRYSDELAEIFPYWQDSFSKIPEHSKAHICSLDEKKVWPSSFWIRKMK